MKYVVAARTTDNWFTNDVGQQMARPLIEIEISQPLSSKEEADRWIEKVYRDHPELFEAKRLIPNRELEIGVKGVEK